MPRLGHPHRGTEAEQDRERGSDHGPEGDQSVLHLLPNFMFRRAKAAITVSSTITDAPTRAIVVTTVIAVFAQERSLLGIVQT